MIDLNKKYLTADGRAVEILRINIANQLGLPVVAIVTDSSGQQSVNTYSANGEYFTDRSHPSDLVEIGPYDDFKIDDPIMVLDSDNQWVRRHFAGVSEDRRPLAWYNGRTSFTANGDTAAWHSCRRPTEEELKGAGK